MTDENQNQTVALAPFVTNNDEKLELHVQETAQLRHKIANLLQQVDLEAEQFRHKIANLLQQVRTLRESSKSNGALEDLVLQLREANQNLVIATLGAQDMQGKAEAVNRQQEEFLSMLAHELRNPLAPIAMACELLGKITTAHPQLPKLHGIMCRQTNHLTHLVDDLVDASRLSSGKIRLQKRMLRLSEIIESAVETSQPLIDKRHQHLTIDMPVDTVIDGDLVRLAQVFSNLLINAAKFTPEHEEITISSRSNAHAVTVTIKDNGIGIDREIQPYIFDLFRQGYRSLDRSQGGLGIGLSLVRTILEMHGGTVKVHSEGVGLGSEFIVSLPTSNESLPNDSNPPPTIVSARYCRILLIEDNVDSNETLKDLLELEGHTVTSTFDGTSGLAKAKENTYDVIVCDIGLPGMDGYEVVKQLRHHASRPVPCIIALTGYNQTTNRDRATEAGFDHYLVKPISVDMLVNLIATGVPG
jgi:signal transduction histidine kinase